MILSFLYLFASEDIFVLTFLAHTISRKTSANFRCNLAIGHFVHGFNRKDMTFESFKLKTFF